jgi:hypothetical protein
MGEILSNEAGAMWNSVEVAVGQAVHRGRYRVEGGMVVLEWRGGREVERCGLLRPDFVALNRFKQVLREGVRAA